MRKIDFIIKIVIRWIKTGKLGEYDYQLGSPNINEIAHLIVRIITFDAAYITNDFEKEILQLCKPYLIQELKDVFVLFLEEHNIKDEFERCYLSSAAEDWRQMCNKISTPTIDNYLAEQIPQRYLLDAFRWAGTRHGDTFWRELNGQWINVITKQLLGDDYMVGRIKFNFKPHFTTTTSC